MNKPTTNIYFPFFSVPYHLILHGKISGVGEIRASKFGALIFGPRIFWFRRESDKSLKVKLHGTKKN